MLYFSAVDKSRRLMHKYRILAYLSGCCPGLHMSRHTYRLPSSYVELGFLFPWMGDYCAVDYGRLRSESE